jgi:hypothetical protein
LTHRNRRLKGALIAYSTIGEKKHFQKSNRCDSSSHQEHHHHHHSPVRHQIICSENRSFQTIHDRQENGRTCSIDHLFRARLHHHHQLFRAFFLSWSLSFDCPFTPSLTEKARNPQLIRHYLSSSYFLK